MSAEREENGTAALPSATARRRRRGRAARLVAGTVTVAVAAVSAATAVGSADPGPAPVPSAGCKAAAVAPGGSTVSFPDAGMPGSYIQDIPGGPAAHGPMPVVFDLHGYMETAALHHDESGLGAFGAGHGFVTITPETNEPGLPRWEFGQNGSAVTYLGDLLTNVERTLCVDQRRVFVTGLSMGAFTSSSIACQLADRFAAAAPVAGLQDFSWCRPSRHVPIVAFHGTDDPILAYTGGTGPHGDLLPAPDGSGLVGQQERANPNAPDLPNPKSIPVQTGAWATRDGCGAQATEQQVTADVTRTTYPCAADSTVELYSVHGGGHTWPGTTSALEPTAIVGATTTTISADQIMWDFFQSHPLRGAVR